MNRRAEAGRIVIADPGSDTPVQEFGLLQCVHCGGQFPAKPSKGRGFCMNCSGPICGISCLECVPEDLYLTNMEKGRPDTFKPICVPVTISTED